jgi:hypothetical protein
LAIAGFADRPLLVDQLLKVEGSLDNPQVRQMIVKLAPRLRRLAEREVTEALALELRTDGAAAATQLIELEPDLAAGLLRAAMPSVVDDARRKIEAAVERVSDEQVAEGLIPIDESEVALRQERASASMSQISEAIRAFASENRELAELAFTALLGLEGEQIEEIVTSSLEEIDSISGEEAARALFTYALRWGLEDTATYLGAIEPGAFGRDGPPVDLLLSHIWSETKNGIEPVPERLFSTLARLLRRAKRTQASPAARSAIAGSLQSRIESENEAVTFESRVDHAERLVDARLITSRDVAGAVAESIAATVAPEIGPESTEVQRHLLGWVRRLAAADRPQLLHAHEALRSDHCWVSSPERERLELELGLLLRKAVEVPDAAELRELAQQHGSAAAPAVALWIEHYALDPDAVSPLLKHFAASPPTVITNALQRFTQNRSRDKRTRLALPLLEGAFTWRTSARLLRAMRADVAQERRLVAVLLNLALNFGRRLNRRKRNPGLISLIVFCCPLPGKARLPSTRRGRRSRWRGNCLSRTS